MDFFRMNNTRNCSRELPKYFALEMFWWFWGATLRFEERPYARMCMNTWHSKKLLTLAPHSFLPRNTHMQSPFCVKFMRLRVFGETMIPQGTHSLLGNVLVVVGTSRRVTTLSGHSDWPRCKRGDELSCIFTKNTGSAAAAAAPVRLFALLRLWRFKNTTHSWYPTSPPLRPALCPMAYE